MAAYHVSGGVSGATRSNSAFLFGIQRRDTGEESPVRPQTHDRVDPATRHVHPHDTDSDGAPPVLRLLQSPLHHCSHMVTVDESSSSESN